MAQIPDAPHTGAAMLWSKGASFGGVMRFLGADLVVATVIIVHARNYGWRYALYLSAVLYVCMVAAGVTGQSPRQRPVVEKKVNFALDYALLLNLAFIAMTAILLWIGFGRGGSAPSDVGRKPSPAASSP